ncbi:MAG: hypothetical protein P8Y54_02975 [Xanthomonadales bacterium]
MHIRKLAVLLLAIVWLLPAAAQDSQNIGTLVKITPKKGHSDELVEAITEYHEWIADKEGAMRYNWYEVLTGPDTGLYYAWSGGHDWKDFDAEYDWQSDAGEMMRDKVMPHVEDMDRMMVRTMNNWSHWPEDWAGYTHFHLTDWYVNNGQNMAFRKGLMKIVSTLKAADYSPRWGFHWMESGTRGGHVVLVSPTKGWAGMTAPDTTFYDIMSKELGGEEAFETFMADWGKTFKTGATTTVEYMPGASDYGDD